MRKYNKVGIADLFTGKSGRPKGDLKWSNKVFSALTQEIDKGTQYWSIPLMQQWIQKNFDKEVPESTIWYRIDQLEYSHKSARPHPCKGDVQKQERFKKGSHRSTGVFEIQESH